MCNMTHICVIWLIYVRRCICNRAPVENQTENAHHIRWRWLHGGLHVDRCLCVRLSVCPSICLPVCACACVYECVRVRVHVRVHVCMRMYIGCANACAWVCVYVCACVYVRVCVCVCVYVCVCVRMIPCTGQNIDTQAHIRMHMHTHRRRMYAQHLWGTLHGEYFEFWPRIRWISIFGDICVCIHTHTKRRTHKYILKGYDKM